MPFRRACHNAVVVADDNLLKNNTNIGTVAGTPGTPPKSWWVFNNDSAKGISTQIVGSGVEDGIDYVDFRVFGTPGASPFGTVQMFFTGPTVATRPQARVGQIWTVTMNLRLVAGALPAIFGPSFNELDANQNFAGKHPNNVSSATPTTTPSLGRQRYYYSDITTNSVTAYVDGYLNIQYGSTAIDCTIRIGEPELNLGYPDHIHPRRRSVA